MWLWPKNIAINYLELYKIKEIFPVCLCASVSVCVCVYGHATLHVGVGECMKKGVWEWVRELYTIKEIFPVCVFVCIYV